MPKVAIIMPQLGESIAEATVLHMLVEIGDELTADQEVMEVETNKAVMGVTVTCGGTLCAIKVSEGETIEVGGLLGLIEATPEEIERCGATIWDETEAPTSKVEKAVESASSCGDDGAHFKTQGEYREGEKPQRLQQRASNRGLPVPSSGQNSQYLSPRIKARMQELGMTTADLAYISGTGAGGRITIEDFESLITYADQYPSRKVSSMRKSVADSMLRTWKRPIASAGRPIFMAPILLHRKSQQRKPGITLYFVRALALALAKSPESAAFMLGGRILTPKQIDLGVAVQVEEGVMVPVLRSVNEYTMEELVEQYDKVVKQARARRLDKCYVGGGIATVTNFGGFGLTDGTPMPLPSESLILGVGAVQRVPVWSDEVQCFLPVDQAKIVASFDHRVVDGGDIGRLMQDIAYYLEHPDLL